MMQQNVVALLQLRGNDAESLLDGSDYILCQFLHIARAILLEKLLHAVSTPQQSAVVDVSNKGEILARILHRVHRVIALVLRDLLASIDLFRVGRGQHLRGRHVHQLLVHAVEHARRVSLFLEGRENQDLTEAERLRRELERV